MAFLAMCFAVVGLTGLFASYVGPLPYERADLRDAVLDEALATATLPDGPERLAALRTRLDSSAAVVIDGKGALPDRVATARTAMRAEMRHEADAIGSRLRLMLFVITAVAAGFGMVLLGAAARVR